MSCGMRQDVKNVSDATKKEDGLGLIGVSLGHLGWVNKAKTS